MEKQVGDFTLLTESPWPWHITIKQKNGMEIRFEHRQLDDLEYVIKAARAHIERK